MKWFLFALSLLFFLLTFLGAGRVMQSGGSLNAGYAVVPMVLGLAFLQGYLFLQRKTQRHKRIISLSLIKGGLHHE